MNGYLPAFTFILFRVLGATALFWLLFFKTEKIQTRDYFKFAIAGVFGVAANQLMFFEGLDHTSTINASIIMVNTPILVLIFSSILLKERISSRKIIGVLIGLIGAVSLILFKDNSVKNEATLYGDLFIFLNASSYALYLVLVKPLMKKYSPYTVIKWVFTFGLIYVIPFGISQFGEVNFNMSNDIVLKVIFIIIFTTFLTYLLTMYGLNKVSPTTVSSYVYLQPVLTTAIALILGFEQPTWTNLFCGVIIFIGVYLVSFKPKNKR
jgi:drug/metabolite transporter (DMT)-like permease